MQLFYSPTSPYVRKVVALIHEAQISGIEIIPASGTPTGTTSLPSHTNPLGKVPTLVTDQGLALYDSRVICRYLDSLSGGRFYPQGEKLWQYLTLEALADGILDAALLIVYEHRLRPEELQFDAWITGQWGKIERALACAEAEHISVAESEISVASLALGSALGYLDLRFSDRDWRQNHPKLAAWWQAFSQRPSMRASTAKI